MSIEIRIPGLESPLDLYADHKVFLRSPVQKTGRTKERRVTLGSIGEHRFAEIRDWVHVPETPGGTPVWRVSSGILIPLEELNDVIEALQSIKHEYLPEGDD